MRAGYAGLLKSRIAGGGGGGPATETIRVNSIGFTYGDSYEVFGGPPNNLTGAATAISDGDDSTGIIVNYEQFEEVTFTDLQEANGRQISSFTVYTRSRSLGEEYAGGFITFTNAPNSYEYGDFYGNTGSLGTLSFGPITRSPVGNFIESQINGLTCIFYLDGQEIELMDLWVVVTYAS